MFLPHLPGPCGPGNSDGGHGRRLGNLGGNGCPGNFFLHLALLRLKVSTLFWKKFLEITLLCAVFWKAFTAVFTGSFRIFSVFEKAEYFLLEIIEIYIEILMSAL